METTLDKLPLNKKGIIKKIDVLGSTRRRLLDLGFIKDTNIIPVLDSFSKGVRAFYIRGTLIALRDEDSSLIKVSFK